jgi:hypothetical protein
VPAKTIDGIDCNYNEVLGAYHEHAHLNIIIRGKSLALPIDIGNKENTDHECLYWMHTHNPSLNVIHLEAPHVINPTLGTFFDVWGQPLSAQRIWKYAVKSGESMKIYVNRKSYTGNLRNIPLRRHTDVTIEVGPPFVPEPKPFDFTSRQL